MFLWKKLKRSFSHSTPNLLVPPSSSPIQIVPLLKSQDTPPPPMPQNNGSLFPWSTHDLRLSPPLRQSKPGVPQLDLPPFSPFPRYGFASPQNPSPENDLYIFGGLVANKEQNDLYKLSTSDISSTLVETSGEIPSPRVGHSSVLFSHVFIVWGGDTNVHQRPNHVQDNALYFLNIQSREWTRVDTTGPTPVGRYGHTLVSLGTKIILFGGQSDHQFFDDLWAFELKSLKSKPVWDRPLEPATRERPAPRTCHICVAYGEDQLIIFGGTDGKFYYNDTWLFNLQTRIWTELLCSGHIPAPRESHAATVVDDMLYIFGGRGLDARDLGDLVVLKISTRRWYAFQDAGVQQLPSARSGHAMATVANRVYLFGGDSFTKQVLDDSSAVHVLDTALLKYPERRGTTASKASNSSGSGSGTRSGNGNGNGNGTATAAALSLT